MPVAQQDTSLDEAGRKAVAAYARAMDACDLRGGAEAAWELVATANLYIQQVAPWALAKAERDAELDVALAALARALYRLAVLAEPFIPGKGQCSGIRWVAGESPEATWKSLAAPPIGGAGHEPSRVAFPQAKQLSRS